MSQPVSSRWYPTLMTSHNIAAQFIVGTSGMGSIIYQSPVFINPGATNGSGEILTEDWPAISTTGHVPKPGITGGSVTQQKNQDQRWTCQMTVVDPTGYLDTDDVFDPFGNELQIYTGLAYNDGSYELKLIGTFRMTDVEIKDSGGAVTIQINGQDRSRIIARNTANLYYQTGLNQAYTDTIRQIAQKQYPGVVFNGTAQDWLNTPPVGIGQFEGGDLTSRMIFTPGVYGLTFQDGDNLWSESRNMAAALSCDLFFGRRGWLNLYQDPNMNYMNGSLPALSNPITTFVEGETCTFISMDKKKSDQDAYSAVVITGEGQILGQSQLPIRSITATDNDPTSPTYVNGPYGQVLYEETNDYMLTQAQINQYANFKLATMVGRQQVIQIEGFSDSSLDVDDVIAATRNRLGIVNQLFIVDTIQYPITVQDTMKLTTRERRALTYTPIGTVPS